MPLVSADDSAEYLDVAHLAEEGTEGAADTGAVGAGRMERRRTRTSSNRRDNTSGDGAAHNHSTIDPEALVDMPAFSSSDVQGLLPAGSISRMIAPRYLSRESHARPPEVHARHLNDSAASIDDGVSVMTLDTVLKQMDASGEIHGLSEREMAVAAARGEYNARVAALSRRASEAQSEPAGDDQHDQRHYSHKNDRRIEESAGHRHRGNEESDYEVPIVDHSSSSQGNRAGRRQLHHHLQQQQHHHHRSSLQNRYSGTSYRSQHTHDTNVENIRSMKTINSDDAEGSNASKAESKAESRTSHYTPQERGRTGLGGSMWSAKVNREERRQKKERVRSHSRDSARKIMERLLIDENTDEEDEIDHAASAGSPKRNRLNDRDVEEAEATTQAQGGDDKNKNLHKSHRERTKSLADEVTQREYRQNVGHDGSTSTRTGASLRALRTAGVGLTSTAASVRASFHSALDDEIDEETEFEATASAPPPSSLIRSASSTLSNLAKGVSSNRMLNRQDIEDLQATISDLEANLNSTRQALQHSEVQVTSLKAQLANTTADLDRAERNSLLLEMENESLQKRVEEMERREFGRAMGMTTGRAGTNAGSTGVSNTTNTAPVGTSEAERKKNRVQPRRDSNKSLGSLGLFAQDIDLESVVSAGTGDKGGILTEDVNDRNHEQENHETGNTGIDQVESINKAQTIDNLPLEGQGSDEGDNARPHFTTTGSSEPPERSSHPPKQPGASSRKRSGWGFGKLMDTLQNESVTVLNTLQEETSENPSEESSANITRGGVVTNDGHGRRSSFDSHIKKSGLNNRTSPDNCRSSLDPGQQAGTRHVVMDYQPTYDIDQPSSDGYTSSKQSERRRSPNHEIADEISHKVSSDIRNWGNGSKKEANPSPTSDETAETSMETHMSSSFATSQIPNRRSSTGPPATKPAWLSKGLMTLNDSIRGIGAGTADGDVSVVSANNFSVRSGINLAMHDEIKSK